MSRSIALIDAGSGNLRSVAKALERAGEDAGVAIRVLITRDAGDVARADAIVLPGQGAFATVMRGLSASDGLIDALTETVHQRGRPFLGICVGMQILVEAGLEHGRHAGLGWSKGICLPLAPADARLKIPHMGWNTLALAPPIHPLLAGLPADPHVYFVHSYAVSDVPLPVIQAESDYGGPITAAIGTANWFGTQFHVEKSQAVGLAILRNFLVWRP